MLIRPDELPCPNCEELLWHSFIGAPSDDLSPDPVPDLIEEIWTDGYIPAVDAHSGKRWPILPEHGEFIARCPKCRALYPDHFIPWTNAEISGSPNPKFVMPGTAPTEAGEHNELGMADLAETLLYLEHLEESGLTPHWECWTAIQQVILLTNKLARESGNLADQLQETVRSAMRIVTGPMGGAMEGAFITRSLLPRDSERVYENLPNDWATFSDMYRISGDFDRASQYLNYASNSLDRGLDDFDNSGFFGFDFERPRILRQKARIELLRELIFAKSTIVAASSIRAKRAEDIKRVYTFYINDPDAEIGVYGQVASSQEEVETSLRAKGLTDFFLFEERDLGPEESESAADFRVKLSPHLGPNWIPIVNAIQLVLEDKRSSFFNIQTLAKEYGFDPHESPYIQGMVLEDGRFHLEAPKFFLEEGRLSEQKIQQLQFIGWNLPGDTDSTYNFWRAFDYGWNARSVAEFALETLTSVFGVTETDFFDFGSVWQPEEIWKLQELYRVPIAESNPKGSIFRIPDDSKYRVDSFENPKGKAAQNIEPQASSNPYPESHERRVANYIQALNGVRDFLMSVQITQTIGKIETALSAFEDKGFRAAAEHNDLILDAIQRIPQYALSEKATSELREVSESLWNSIAAFPHPIGEDKSVSFNDIPPGLQKLLSEMVQRVLKNHPQEGNAMATSMFDFVEGRVKILESELQVEMSSLLRILAKDSSSD